MQITTAVLADAANIAPGEKLNILGIFDTIIAQTFPAEHPMTVLAIRFQLGFEDAGQHRMEIDLKDEDSKVYGRGLIQMNVAQIPAGEFGHANAIFHFPDMKFGRPGRFHFDISWDGKSVHKVQLGVIQAPGPAPQAP